MRWTAESYVGGHRVILAVAAVAIVAGAGLLVRPGLREDYSIRSFVGAHSDEYRRFEHFLNLFVSNEIGLIAVRGEDPLSPRSLARLRGWSVRIAALEGVESVTALSDVPLLPEDEGSVFGRAGRLLGALIRPQTAVAVLAEHPERREAVRAQLLANPLVRDVLLSTVDAETTAVLIQASAEAAGGMRRKEIVSALREIVAEARAESPDLAIVLAGPLVTMIDIFEYLHRDLLVFSGVVSGLIGIVLVAIFRRVAPLLMAGFAAWGSVVATLGLAAGLQLPVSLITNMVVVLASIIAVAMCVHLLVVHEEVCGEAPTLGRRERAAMVLRRAGLPCVYVAVTTGAGFGSLGISNLAPIRTFSWLMLFGVFVALVLPTAAVCVLPAVSAVPAVSGAATRKRKRRAIGTLLERLVGAASRRRGLVIGGFAMATALVAAGMTRLEFESDFIKNFRAGSEVRESYEFVQRYLAPVGSLELVLTTVGDRPIVRPDVLAAVDALSEEVVERFDLIGKGLSLADLMTLGGLPLPTSGWDVRLRLAALEQVEDGRLLRNFVSSDRRYLRTNFRAREAGSVHEKLSMAAAVERMARARLPDDVTAEVTGLYPFYAGLIKGVLRDQYRSFTLAAVAIFGVMWVAMRSLRVAVIGMIPNLLPMVLTLGFMGWFGLKINMATAMMLSVSLGIAVDNTIHYLWRFRRELAATDDYAEAMRRTHGTTGRACVFSAVVIAGGFWILCLSEFLPTAYFGAMVGVTMLCALAADMVLLPVLLVTFRPFRT